MYDCTAAMVSDLMLYYVRMCSSQKHPRVECQSQSDSVFSAKKMNISELQISLIFVSILRAALRAYYEHALAVMVS